MTEQPEWTGCWMSRLPSDGCLQANPQAYTQDEGSGLLLKAKPLEALPGKTSKLQSDRTVPQTDTGGRAEYAQALERTREKELGKLTP